MDKFPLHDIKSSGIWRDMTWHDIIDMAWKWTKIWFLADKNLTLFEIDRPDMLHYPQNKIRSDNSIVTNFNGLLFFT